jgi:hypothetical protein
MVIVCPETETGLPLRQCPPLTFADDTRPPELPVVAGAVHPAGTVTTTFEPTAKAVALVFVKVNVKILLFVPSDTLVGETVIVPSPLTAADASAGALMIKRSGRAPVMRNFAMRFLYAPDKNVCIT